MMKVRNSVTRWGAGAQLLHWLMAFGITTSMVLGWVMVNLPMGALKFQLYSVHKSLGVTLLALFILRLVWRQLNITPAMPESMSRLERVLAVTTHRSLYALMLLMPLSGYVINSAANFPLSVFGLVQIPNLTPESQTLQAIASNLHLGFFWGFFGLLFLHVAGALRHHFLLRDNTLLRMLPTKRRVITGSTSKEYPQS